MRSRSRTHPPPRLRLVSPAPFRQAVYTQLILRPVTTVKYQYRVLGLLSLLSIITYLDRVCIAVAGPRMQDSLHISPQAWGWVTGVLESWRNSQTFARCASIAGESMAEPCLGS